MKKLTSKEKAIVKNLNSALYTVQYLEEWINNNDDIFSNAIGALTAMGAKGFYDAIQLQVKIQKKIRDEYMVSGICLALAEIASGAEIVEVLENAGITTNKNTVPGETRSPFVTSGIRVGSPALTARGMKGKEFEFIGNKIADVLSDISNSKLQAQVKEEVRDLAHRFIIYDRAMY